MTRLSFLLAIALPALAAADLYEPMQPPFVAWVEDGRPIARIVSDPFPDDGPQPAEILNGYLEKITGARLPMAEQPEADAPTVFLGPGAGLSRLPEDAATVPGPEGFVIQSLGKDLVISGTNRLGTTYAVYAFLEECLGMRWFWASETGEYCPDLPTLRVGQVHKAQAPDFRMRWVGRGDWALANRMNVSTGHPEEFRTKWFVHTFLDLVPPDRYWREHPEYYAERGGERQDPTDGSRDVQLCTSNPAVAEAVARTIDEVLEAEPGLRMISVDPMDSQNFCQCADCLALDEPDAPYPRRNSRRLVLFYNRVAGLVGRKHPDVLLKSIAYHSYVAPPAEPDLKVADNVVIQFCRFECHNHALDDPGCPANVDFNHYLLGWRRIAPNLSLYEYYWKVSWLNLPWPIVHTLGRDLPYLRDLGVMGVATQYTTNFATNGLDYYVAAKLLWDADLDVDALVGDFYEKAYAEAVEPMSQYHERLERAAVEAGVHLASQRPYDEALRLFTPELLAELDDCIAHARAVVRDPRAQARVEMAAQGLQYTHLVVDYLRAVDKVRRKSAQSPWRDATTPEQKEEALRRAGPAAQAIRDYISDPTTSPAVGRINSYIENLLRPEVLVGSWVPGSLTPDTIALTKAAWLREHPQQLARDLPASVDLWVYGNDLDFTEGKPEHTILARPPAAEEVVVGHVGTAERPGDSVHRCYVLKGLQPALLTDRALRLIVTNDPGGPYGSHFFAFYAMPPSVVPDDDGATLKIETDLGWVRERALGFVEYGYSGLASNDNERHEVTIAIEGTPTGQ